MQYKDVLEPLNRQTSIRDKLVHCHSVVQQYCPGIARIAVTLYDPATAVLKTYLHSSGEDDPLSHYQASLDDAPSLKAILDKGEPRVINNMLTFEWPPGVCGKLYPADVLQWRLFRFYLF
jgi:hypothetical protein